MTTAELRSAAEMVVATGTDKDWFDTIDAGALAVCRAWLAANPADADEPIDPAFLRSLGFAADPDYPRAMIVVVGTSHTSGHAVRLAVCEDGTVGLDMDDREGKPVAEACLAIRAETRGDVRKLLAALNG
jgi:hypothetical protein